MYEFIDRPVYQQTEGVRLLVWGMRRWVRAAREERCVCRFLASVFETAGVPKAAAPLAATMRILVGNMLVPLRFGAIEHPVITEHEAVLLGALVTASQGEGGRCHTMARLLVHADMAPALASSLIGFAQALAEAGVQLAPEVRATGPGGSDRA